MSEAERYARQTVLPEIGVSGQARLRDATVCVAGAGGLGCAVLAYLAAAGVGRLIVADHDRVEESNLHRQPLYGVSDCGRLKVEAAAAALERLNPYVAVEGLAERITPANAAAFVARGGLIVDAADSLALTYMLSDACLRAGKGLISASVLGMSGYAGGFCGSAPSYRAVFPDMPAQAGSCAQTGVLGTAVGVLGTLQSQLALAALLALQPSPLGRLISVDLQALRFGGFEFTGAAEPPADDALRFIAPDDVLADDMVIDVRSVAEAPASPFAGARRVATEEVGGLVRDWRDEQRIVICCRSGVRAWRAARSLQRRGHTRLALIALGA